MDRYVYYGPVYGVGGTLLDRYFKAETYAASKGEAFRNIVYQYKINHDFIPKARISIDASMLKIVKE